MTDQLLAERIEDLQLRMERAAAHSGRAAGAIKLIAVSKTVGVEQINAAIALGITRIGENRVQELMQKLPALLPCERHFIGALQANKAKHLVGQIALLHSLGSASTAQALETRCAQAGWVCPVLLQVNIGGESSKSGVMPDELEAWMETLLPMKHIEVRGLMCVPPPAQGDEARRHFAQLRACLEALQAAFPEKKTALRELSMGMSGDFEEAIAEGATYVRIGSQIFGHRYKM